MFNIFYEPIESDFGWLHIFIAGRDISRYIYKGKQYCCACRAHALKSWFENNLQYITSNYPYPIDVNGESGVQLWNNSEKLFGNCDVETSLRLLEKCQTWLWRHSIDTCRDEFCLPFVIFRRIGEQIEISWDNTAVQYQGVDFIDANGISYVPIGMFEDKVKAFLKTLK